MIRDRADAAWGDDLHRRYRPRAGSDYIASGFALGAIRTLVRRRQPRSVLEVGAGIGAVTSGLAEVLADQARPAVQVAVEDVPFCLEQLALNLGDQLDAVTVVGQVRQIPAGLGDFDLVVIDGGSVGDLLDPDRSCWSEADEEAEVAAWMARLASGALVLVENRRDRQRGFIEVAAVALSRHYAHEHIRPLDASPGVHVYWFEPARSVALAAWVRERARRAWFPNGVRMWRRVNSRLGRTLVNRDAVASGGAGGSGDQPG